MGHTLNYLRLQLGKLAFLLIEPIFQFWENRDSDVRVHLHQGLICLDRGETAVALLNLNMVLSLKQNHFLALVKRGQLYLKEGQCQLAAHDFLKASRVSTYRFSHHGLNNEYIRLLKKGVNDLDAPTVRNFSEILDPLNELNGGSEELESYDVAFPGERPMVEQRREDNREHTPIFKRLTSDELDREKFDKLGPITQQELDNTDWNQLTQNFTS